VEWCCSSDSRTSLLGGFFQLTIGSHSGNSQRAMVKYFFSTVAVFPQFEEKMLRFGQFAVHRRLWQTSTFDLATLATKHTLHIPYQLMEVFLGDCHLELELDWDGSFESAQEEMEIIRALLYLDRLAPFVIPFVATHSINDYSGINSRDSELLRPKMPEEMRAGFTSNDGKVEAWYMDSTLKLIRASGTDRLSAKHCADMGARLNHWRQIEQQHSLVNIARRILNSAPMLHDMAASILQIWQGIESLFPTVTSEVSFRIALLVAQLCRPIQPQATTYKQVRAAYSVRSKITHGSALAITSGDWSAAWLLLCMCLKAVFERKQLPSEKELMSELLPGEIGG
jgi:hypothetical protein